MPSSLCSSLEKKNGLCFCLTAQSCRLREGSSFLSGWMLLLLSLKEKQTERAVGGYWEGALSSCDGTVEGERRKEGDGKSHARKAL